MVFLVYIIRFRLGLVAGWKPALQTAIASPVSISGDL